MKEFLHHNRHKIPFVFLISGIFPAFTLTLFLIVYLVDEFNLLIFLTLMGTGFFLQFLVLILGYLEWIGRRNSRERIFSRKPFNQLTEIGFTTGLFNENNKWYFTESLQKGEIDGFQISIDPMLGYPNMIGLVADVEEYHDYKALTKRFDNNNLAYGRDGITKKYDTKKPRNLKQFVAYTERFTKILKEEGFEPKKTL